METEKVQLVGDALSRADHSLVLVARAGVETGRFAERSCIGHRGSATMTGHSVCIGQADRLGG